MLVTFIKAKLMTRRGTFDANKSNIKWYQNNNYINEYNQILDSTDFLGESYTFSSRIYCILNDINIAPICPECNNKLRKFKSSSEGFFETCSSKCSANSDKRWIKYKETNLEKYGVEFSTQSTDVKDKIEATLVKNYGVTSTFKSKEILEKIENTNIERYGSSIGFSSNIIKDKILKTNLEKYGAVVPNSNPEVLKLLSDKDWLSGEFLVKKSKVISTELGCSISFVNYWARIHQIENRVTIYSEENEIAEFLLLNGIKDVLSNVYGVIGNPAGLGRRQLDLYIKDKTLAIELNGVYWHSDDKIRHLEKLNLCREKDIKLLQFWDYQWNEKRNICESIIKSNLGLNERIFARKCKIVLISSKEYKDFLDHNHLQGNTNSAIRYGLMYNGNLVSAIGFSKSRYNKNYDWELIRYVNRCGINVVGGFSRLLKVFRDTNTGSIISYCDLMVFNGKMYKDSGFRLKEETSPGFFYIKGNQIFSRERLQKHKLKDILKDFDSTKTADQNLLTSGYSKVWNCGNGVWELD